jgi:hypothetical protein
MRSKSLPSALPDRAKKLWKKILPQYKIDFSAMYRLKPSFGGCKNNNYASLQESSNQNYPVVNNDFL